MKLINKLENLAGEFLKNRAIFLKHSDCKKMQLNGLPKKPLNVIANLG